MEAGATRTGESREAALIQPPPATAAAPLRPCRRAPPSDPAAAAARIIPSSAKPTKFLDGKTPHQKNNDYALTSILALSGIVIAVLTSLGGMMVALGHGESSPAACLERVNIHEYFGMASRFADGLGRHLLFGDDSNIWLDTIPKHGNTLDDGKAAGRRPFLNASDIARQLGADDGLQIKGIEVHPEFATNGRFLISYIYSDRRSSKWWLVVAELSAQDSKKMDTIFTTELPQDQEVQLSGSNQGGQIFFKHTNNTSYIYIVIGHGVMIKSDAGYVDLSSDESSLLGKVIRVEIPETLPKTHQIVAKGIADPKGCNINPDDRRCIFCSLVVDGTAQVRLINIESVRETYTLIFNGSLPEITGGFKYDRASTDPSLERKYIFFFNSSMYTATEIPEGSGHYIYARITKVGCSKSSPKAACDPKSFTNSPGFVHFIGEDSNGDALLFTPMGIYRLVHPALCHYPTVVDDGAAASVGKHRRSPPAPAHWSMGKKVLVYGGAPSLFFAVVWAIWYCVYYIVLPALSPGTDGGGGGQQAPTVAVNNNLTVNNNFSCFNIRNFIRASQGARAQTIELQQAAAAE
ncbi:HIPL2 protein-like [Oryza glaberrima]|uniref:HIPL2 protein-like n=1 Tax=Oryza glaberrima TaxID=4538 RepID=UPI00023DF6EB|nr:HIPL2 protein-like [Oryza glaberrima]